MGWVKTHIFREKALNMLLKLTRPRFYYMYFVTYIYYFPFKFSDEYFKLSFTITVALALLQLNSIMSFVSCLRWKSSLLVPNQFSVISLSSRSKSITSQTSWAAVAEQIPKTYKSQVLI